MRPETENDQKNAIDYARKMGREEGRAEGMEKGIAKGRAEEKLSVARKMLAAGLDVKSIADMTGLAEQEIRGL